MKAVVIEDVAPEVQLNIEAVQVEGRSRLCQRAVFPQTGQGRTWTWWVAGGKGGVENGYRLHGRWCRRGLKHPEDQGSQMASHRTLPRASAQEAMSPRTPCEPCDPLRGNDLRTDHQHPPYSIATRARHGATFMTGHTGTFRTHLS